MANKARRKRQAAGRAAAVRKPDRHSAKGTAKDIRSKKATMAPYCGTCRDPQPIWSRTRKTNAPHCGTYDARRKQMTMAIEDVGPDIALENLGKSTGNRGNNQHAVNRYAADMLREKWVLSPQGISFDSNRVFIDGHTRMLAIIKSGKTVKMVVFRDVPPETVAFLDYGRGRYGKDILAREGIKSSKKVMETTKAMVLGYNGSRGGDISEDQYVSIAMAHLADIEWLFEELGKQQRAPVVGAILRAVVNEGTTERLQLLCNHIRDNTNEGKDCPLNALKRYLTKVAAKTASGHHNDVYPRAAAAARAFIDGKKVTRLLPSKGDYWPFDLD